MGIEKMSSEEKSRITEFLRQLSLAQQIQGFIAVMMDPLGLPKLEEWVVSDRPPKQIKEEIEKTTSGDPIIKNLLEKRRAEWESAKQEKRKPRDDQETLDQLTHELKEKGISIPPEKTLAQCLHGRIVSCALAKITNFFEGEPLPRS